MMSKGSPRRKKGSSTRLHDVTIDKEEKQPKGVERRERRKANPDGADGDVDRRAAVDEQCSEAAWPGECVRKRGSRRGRVAREAAKPRWRRRR